MDLNSIRNLIIENISEHRWLLLIAVVVLVILNLFYKHRYYYEKKRYLCTATERKFLKLLHSILPKHYYIHCQTSLISLLKPADLRSARMVWAKRMDFVITDRKSEIILVIELDDRSHERKDRKKRDKFVNKALKGKHPFIRITTEQMNELSYVRAEIEKNLEQ